MRKLGASIWQKRRRDDGKGKKKGGMGDGGAIHGAYGNKKMPKPQRTLPKGLGFRMRSKTAKGENKRRKEHRGAGEARRLRLCLNGSGES